MRLPSPEGWRAQDAAHAARGAFLIIREIPTMDSGLQVLISPPLITSKEHAEGYCACFPSELSSGQPLARGRLTPPVHYRRAHLPTCNSPPLPLCLNKVLSLLKNVRKPSCSFVFFPQRKCHGSSNHAEAFTYHGLLPEPRGHERQGRRKTSVGFEKLVVGVKIKNHIGTCEHKMSCLNEWGF